MPLKLGWNENKQPLTLYSCLTLTQRGREKADSLSATGALAVVLSALNGETTMTISELVQRTGIDEKRLKDLAENNKAYIQVVT